MKTLRTSDIADQVTGRFAEIYTHFKEFRQSNDHRPYWDKCVESLHDRDFLVSVIFCNDVFDIPPVKTFLTKYRDDFILLTGKPDARLDIFVKRGIGAFWGMVFKFVLGYRGQQSVSVSMNKHFMVKTATVFSDPADAVVIE